eukprot:gene17201-19613_t
MDSEFSEFANALLALRMGKSVGKPAAYPSISFSAVSLDDNDSTGGYEDDDLFKSKMSANIVPFPSLSWAPQDFASTYGFVGNSTPSKGKKRLHSISLSATSSESNDSYDVENPNAKKATNANTGSAGEKEKKQSLARGRYRCSLCGAFKTNHVCALIADKLMCNVSTQSLQAGDLVASMLPVHQKELRVQCRNSPSITPSATTAPLSSAAILGSTAATATGGIEIPRVFYERIVTVTRNRTSIQNPAAMAAAAVAAAAAENAALSSTPMTTSEASNDGSTVLSLHKPAFEAGSTGAPVYAQVMATANGAHAVTPTATYSFAPHYAPHLQSTQNANMALPVGPGGYLYPTSMHSSLLSVPLQPSTLVSSAVPSFPQVHHPHQSQAPVKVAPSLIYPSALDLLGQAIYE